MALICSILIVQMETINKLLKKQAPKTSARRKDMGGSGGGDEDEEGEAARPSPVYVRWISSREGNRISVPGEWLASPAAGFAGGGGGGLSQGRKMVEEAQ